MRQGQRGGNRGEHRGLHAAQCGGVLAHQRGDDADRRVKQRRLARLLQRICWRAERERGAAPDGQLLRTARLRRADVERALAKAEAKWIEASEALEGAA